MKTLTVKILSVLSFGIASLALAAAPGVEVTVADAGGRVAYKGRTNVDGTFVTANLPPGKYVVQFTSQTVRGDHTLVVSAGRKKVSAESVSAPQFRGGGVAMRIEVGAGLNITGQVVSVPTGMVAAGNSRTRDASVEAVRDIQDRSGLGGASVAPTSAGGGQ